MKPKHSDFPPGMRVRYKTRFGQGKEMAICGVGDLYMYINIRRYVSGIVLAGLPAYWHDSTFFRPDGWPLPEGVGYLGFVVLLDRLEPYDGPPLPAPLTNGIGFRIPAPQVEKIIAAYYSHTLQVKS